MRKDVLIIVLNYQNPQDTILCLQSLRQHIPAELADILLVENSIKPDGAGKELADFYQIVHNKGYSHGNNVGLRKAIKENYPFSLLLNNDAICDYNFLSPLLLAMEKYEADALSPKIVLAEVNTNGWKKIDRLAFGGAFATDKLEYWYPRGVFGSTPVHSFSNDEPCDWLSGACLLLRNSFLKKVGFLDEDYFLYYEDVDWSLRAKRKGGKLWYIGSESVYHQHSKSTSVVKEFYYPRAFLLFNYKHFPGQFKLAIKRFYFHYFQPHLKNADINAMFNDLKILLSVGRFWFKEQMGNNASHLPEV